MANLGNLLQSKDKISMSSSPSKRDDTKNRSGGGFMGDLWEAIKTLLTIAAFAVSLVFWIIVLIFVIQVILYYATGRLPFVLEKALFSLFGVVRGWGDVSLYAK